MKTNRLTPVLSRDLDAIAVHSENHAPENHAANSVGSANSAGSTTAVGLKAIHAFFHALRQEGIDYCHWKSNLRLELSLRGETDLDLLVRRGHSQRFRQILYAHNIKPVLAAPGKRYPAVEDYLGFDAESGRTFHLHVHYQLVLGEQFVKNYRLPLEEQFLDQVQWKHGVAIPALELEIIVLTLRALLKYRDRDVIKDVLKIRYPGVPSHITDEFRYLMERTTLAKISQTLAKIDHAVPADAVLEFLTLITEQPRAGLRLYALRRRVRQSLGKYQRQNRTQAIVTYMRELWSRRNSFLRFSPSRQMTPVSGGMTLALVGADGAGKSTISKLLRKWLGARFEVSTYYLGSKEPSRRSKTLYTFFRMLRRSHSEVAKRLGEQNVLCRWMARRRNDVLYAYHLSIGHDRFGRYQQGMKKAMDGGMVIFDRFPLETICADDDFRLLDGPQIDADQADAGSLARTFASQEAALYGEMRPPDYLIVLDVSPQVSLQRKPDHQPSAIEAKSKVVSALLAMQGLRANGVNLIHLNADQPLDVVIAQLKARIWELL